MTSFRNPEVDAIRALLQRVKTVAVVGLSPKPERPSFGVARALQRFGYRIVPVRPATTSVLGETCYAHLRDLPFPVDLVNVFRAPEFVPAVVEEAIAIGAPALWLQDGVVHEEAARRAQAAGLTVVMDRCIYRDYMQFMS
ncbi:MAG: CoA-binding protein [Betaproteobacteria bacterium]|nr:CoA-binding protein [Betaproteobacteria bacterium]